jgi:hypothetical protein
MPNEDHVGDVFYPQADAEGELEVESSSSSLHSRQQVLKLAGAAMVGTFGLLGSQEVAHARRRKRRKPIFKASVLGVNVAGPSNGTSGFAASQRVAQTFKSLRSGLLTHVQVEMGPNGGEDGGNYVIQINQVDSSLVPTNTVLGSTKILDASIPFNANAPVLVGGLSVPVEANQTYALVITRPDSTGFFVTHRWPSAYADGRMYFSPSPTSSFNQYFAQGSSEHDLVFSTFVTPS